MKIIFLDFDGCIRSAGSYKLPSYIAGNGAPAPAHPDCVAALNHIIAQTGALIVVSSVWRAGGVSRMRDYLNEWGVVGKVLGCTPDLSRAVNGIYLGCERGTEIGRWLADYQAQREQIESFVILDDDADMGLLLPRLVQTEFELGLTMQHAERAIKLLNENVNCAG